NSSAAPPYRALEHVADAKLSSDLLHIDSLALVSEGRIARDHEQPADAAQGGDDLLDHAVAEIFLLGIATHVLEWQDGDCRVIGQCERRPLPYRRCVQLNAIDADRSRDVLKRVLAHFLEADIELVTDLLIGSLGEANAGGLGDGFKPRCDVHAIAVDVV